MSDPGRSKPIESERRLRHKVRLGRLLRFLQLVLGRGQWNPGSLMRELEVSERTVHRMREPLELAGVPLWFSRDQNAYQVRPDFRFPTLHLTDDQALGQATATGILEGNALRLPNGAKDTTRKFIDSGNEQIRHILDDATRLTQVLDLKIADNTRQREAIHTVQWALLGHRTLTGRYRSPYEPAPVTVELTPCRLVLCKQAWYLIARSNGEDQPRTYRVVRFQALKLTDKPAPLPADFDPREYFGDAWSVYRGDRSYDVELHFTPDAADVVTETTWHHTQTVKRHPDGVSPSTSASTA